MVSGMVFFAILAIMESNHNMFLTHGKTQEEIDQKISALYITMAVQLVCLVTCIAQIVVGTRKEREEEQRQRELDIQNAKDGIDIF